MEKNRKVKTVVITAIVSILSFVLIGGIILFFVGKSISIDTLKTACDNLTETEEKEPSKENNEEKEQNKIETEVKEETEEEKLIKILAGVYVDIELGGCIDSNDKEYENAITRTEFLINADGTYVLSQTIKDDNNKIIEKGAIKGKVKVKNVKNGTLTFVEDKRYDSCKNDEYFLKICNLKDASFTYVNSENLIELSFDEFEGISLYKATADIEKYFNQ